MDDRTECTELADLLAEIATGAGSGSDRARVLRHLNVCEDCRNELGELSRLADEVLLIAPEHEPPAGFESAVLDRITASTAPSSHRTRWRFTRPLLYAAASAVFFAAGAGAVWQATTDERAVAASVRETLEVAHGHYFGAAPLTDSTDTEVGHVFLYDGDPSWVFAVLGPEAPPGTYEIVVSTGGQAQTIAVCEVATSGCGTGATVGAAISAIHDVRLVATDGTAFTARLAERRSAK